MTSTSENFLLPAGLSDGLPPDAGFEAAIVERLMAAFAAWGYERVKPPLLEFETGLLSGPGAAMTAHTFRLMDPVSQRMMGLRADMTPQVARIAASRLKNAPRPLRLSYAGQVLRVKGEQMRPERQIGQAGVELIGAASAAADAEVVLLAADALRAAGITDLVVDLTLPTLAPAILKAAGIKDIAPLIAALDRKDSAAAAQLGGAAAPLLEQLLRAVGPADAALKALSQLDLSVAASEQRARLIDVVALIRHAAPDLNLSIDPTDHRGFEYHSGIAFSLLGPGVRGEFGRGGRYVNQAGEQATGFTLYLDSLLRALPLPPAPKRILLPLGTGPETAAALRAKNWITVQELNDGSEISAEARRLGCTHVWHDGKAMPVG